MGSWLPVIRAAETGANTGGFRVPERGPSLPSPSPPTGGRMLSLAVGEKQTLGLSAEAVRINVEPEGVVSLSMPQSREILLSASAPGYAVMLVQYADGGLERIILHVAAAKSDVVRKLTSQLQEQLADVKGLKVSTDGVTIAFSGEVDAAGSALLKPYVQMLKGVVHDQTTSARAMPSPQATPVPPAPTPPVPTPEPVIVQTPAPGSEYADRIVQIDVQIVEVEKNYGKDLGIKWFANGGWQLSASGTAAYGAQTGSTQSGTSSGDLTGLTDVSNVNGLGTSSGTGVFDVFSNSSGGGALIGNVSLSNVQFIINGLVSRGRAKVLATPKLTVQSGKPANFLVGGELPIVQTNALSSTVEYKKYGTQLDIHPVVVSPDEVFISVKASVSSVDNVQTVQGVPSIRTREASTILTVKEGRSFALAGLLSTEEVSAKDGVPFFSKIPVLGGLFRNTRVQKKDYETILLMTPHILRNGTATVPRAARIQPGPVTAEVIAEGVPAMQKPLPTPSATPSPTPRPVPATRAKTVFSPPLERGD